ncbi:MULTISPECIES: hypothetical protein [Nocardioides]|jgi:hypothetical protein|uniref:hypothetical protein n=1 Tax=Nocardioides TaxID=1839 RepID=UPI000330CDB8|nr:MULTISPECIES: hypothetical protein [Nocardioides]EON22085.1 hypothetical protein CF8_4085 [Nocardioides sp. CF8]
MTVQNDLSPEDVTAYEAEFAKRTPGLYSRYIGAMLYFMGAALIAGAVVHYPIDPLQYTVICIVGAFVFLLGTIVNEFILATERPNARQALGLVAFSLLLSFGVGMVGGGIQHFTQFPERSAMMTPIGLVMSFAAFIAKDNDGRWRHAFSLFGAGVLLVAGLTWVGMTAIGTTIDSEGHSHGGDSTSNAPEAPAEAPAGEDHTGHEPNQAPAEPADDGHTSHSH